MRILRWIYGVTRKDYKKNIFIHEELGIVSIENKMRENCLKWYEHVLMRHSDVIVRKDKIINISGMRSGRGRSKKTLIETISKYLRTLNLTKHMTFFRS